MTEVVSVRRVNAPWHLESRTNSRGKPMARLVLGNQSGVSLALHPDEAEQLRAVLGEFLNSLN